MCGIAGILQTRPVDRDDRSTLQQMTDALAHRGPDGEGFYFSPGIGLGHRRLSIIDLAGGDQPIFNEDRTIAVVFNGEIYNYKELQKSLRDRGHTLATNSDTEVLVHLYEDHGLDFLQHLNGMFAIALWDSRRRRLILARDRLGEKPLYYAKTADSLIFASELKAILQFPGIGREVDLTALDDYLAYGYVPAPRTIYDRVNKLQAAHCLVIENSTMAVTRYWHVDDEVVSVPESETDALEALRELIEDAVRIRLRSDVPVGAFLSGGIDSSLIVALAARQSTNPLQTFTIGFPGLGVDESAEAEALARHCGTQHTTIPLEEIDLTLLRALVRQFDEPFADPSALPTFLVTRESSRYVKVCLSGDGGDELFGGYRRYRHEPLERSLNHIPTGIRSAILGELANVIPNTFPGKGWLERMAVSGPQRLQRKVGIFSQRERAALWKPEFRDALQPDARILAEPFRHTSGSELEQRMAADRLTYLPEDVLTKVDRDSMANSLEVRVPLLDHRIVAYSTRLDYRLKFRDGVGKYALRETLRNLVPAEVLMRKKSGFGIPIGRWLADGMLDAYTALLTTSDSMIMNYMSAKTLRSYLRSTHGHGRDLGGRIWALIWLELWFREIAS